MRDHLDRFTKSMAVQSEGDRLLRSLQDHQKRRSRSRVASKFALERLDKLRAERAPYESIMRAELAWLKCCAASAQHRSRATDAQKKCDAFKSLHPEWMSKHSSERFEKRIFHTMLHASGFRHIP